MELRGAVARIRQMRVLRTRQFAEDAGALAHSVRPASFQKIENFYTATVYEKGAEVVRLLGGLLGEEALRRGIVDYFGRCDGTGATVEDFLACFDLTPRDRAQFMLWYAQSGTPQLEVGAEYESATRMLTLHFTQHTPPTPDEAVKACLPIPVRIVLLDENGRQQSFAADDRDGEQRSATVVVREPAAKVTIARVMYPPVLSLSRSFCAPVSIRVEEPADHLFIRLTADPELFDRWEAAQALATRFALQRLRGAADASGEERLGGSTS